MIYCRGYKQKYINEENKKVVLVQLVCDDTPSNITVDNIVDFPKIYVLPSDIILAPGSVAIVPSKSEMYMLNNDGTWNIVRRNIENNIPYLFRESPAGIGNIMIDKIVGGTIAWNQQIYNPTFSDLTGWTSARGTLTASGGVATLTVTEAGAVKIINNYANQEYIQGHKYLRWANVKTSTALTVLIAFNSNGENKTEKAVSANTWTTISGIVTASATDASDHRMHIQTTATVGDVFEAQYPLATDLTLCFGSTIADYVYTLETATAGSGIVWLRNHGFFTKPYYAYNPGQLYSVNVSKHITRGFNQFDKSSNITLGKIINSVGGENSRSDCFHSDYIRVCSGNTYYFNWSSVTNVYKIACYDINKTFIKTQSSSTLPDNCAYIIINAFQSELDTVCLNLSQPNTAISPHNGDYVHYSENSYTLDPTLFLNGLYKLDADNKLYCDGDTYESDGTVTRNRTRYTVPSNIGLTKDPISSQTTIRYYFHPTLDNCSSSDTSGICDKLSKVDYSTDAVGFYINDNEKRIYIKLNVNTVEEARAIVAGATFEYNVETSTIETADPYINPQVSTPGGTEQYVDYAYSQGTRDVEIPVGHQTLYK